MVGPGDLATGARPRSDQRIPLALLQRPRPRSLPGRAHDPRPLLHRLSRPAPAGLRGNRHTLSPPVCRPRRGDRQRLGVLQARHRGPARCERGEGERDPGRAWRRVQARRFDGGGPRPLRRGVAVRAVRLQLQPAQEHPAADPRLRALARPGAKPACAGPRRGLWRWPAGAGAARRLARPDRPRGLHRARRRRGSAGALRRRLGLRHAIAGGGLRLDGAGGDGVRGGRDQLEPRGAAGGRRRRGDPVRPPGRARARHRARARALGFGARGRSSATLHRSRGSLHAGAHHRPRPRAPARRERGRLRGGRSAGEDRLMCGIAGHVGPTPRELLPAMVGLLKHRGPDDMGIWAAGDIGLGMTRLAIIDLVSGRQPMSDPTGRYWIVFNGEIYNYRQLRAELMTAGRRFQTRSDTEVILHAYAVHGEACVERLAGMFAFAIWDDAARRLFLARDRLGKKPLYYWQRDRLFLFASEPKALLCHPAVTRALDWSALHHYLAFGFTPATRSIFDSIQKLPPAHTATLADGRLTQRRYWRLPPAVAPTEPRVSPEERAATVRAGVREAVRLRLESDVPLGVFLSGGVDSSAVVASMREVTSGRIATFSVGFGRAAAGYDELPYARLVAQRFATDHHEEILEPDVRTILPDIVRSFDEPFGDSSAIPACASRPFTVSSRAGFVTPRARSPTACPTPRRAAISPTGRGASPRIPTQPRPTAISVGRDSSTTGGSRRWRGPRWPRTSDQLSTPTSRARSRPGVRTTRSTEPSASIWPPTFPTTSSPWPTGSAWPARSRCGRRSAITT